MNHEPLEEYKLKLKDLELESKGLYKIHCPSCDDTVSAENLNIQDKIAKCGHCDGVFSFKNKIGNLLLPQKVKQEVLRPEGIDMFYFQNELELIIKRPPSTWNIVWLVFAPFMAIILTALAIKNPNPVLIMVATTLWLSSIYPLLDVLKLTKKITQINIDEHQISIKKRPKKMTPDQSYDVREIDQLYIKRSQTTSYYDVHMIINSPEGQLHKKLVAGIGTKTKARFIEQELERYLGIVDREVIEET